ncbi:hypothetical protein GW17_00025791 [Ensete ventricosum]|nr:hypothetical protein GW17_00025791 [Ensete ventricosum]RZS00574.1 hypothetical protein BHM03_00030303 [Ensete ventricosum]
MAHGRPAGKDNAWATTSRGRGRRGERRYVSTTSPRSFSPRWETFHLLAREKTELVTSPRTTYERPADKDDTRARTTLGKEVCILLFFFPFSPSIDRQRSISPSIDRRWSISPSIDRRRSILEVPHSSERSTYQSIVGSIRTERYGILPLGKANLDLESGCSTPTSDFFSPHGEKKRLPA